MADRKPNTANHQRTDTGAGKKRYGECAAEKRSDYKLPSLSGLIAKDFLHGVSPVCSASPDSGARAMTCWLIKAVPASTLLFQIGLDTLGISSKERNCWRLRLSRQALVIPARDPPVSEAGPRALPTEPLFLFQMSGYVLLIKAAMIAKQVFGRTGHESTRAVFGGAALARVTQDEADRTLEVLLRYGVNHLDVAAGYGDAELRVAPWLKRHPGRFFLATKTGERTYDNAKRQIHQSLERLGVERIDLIQLHSLADPIEWDIALSPNGALEACIEAREQSLVRFIGVTGHGSQIAATHLRSLERFDFDSVLLPYSYIMMQDPHYAAAFERVVKGCRERNTAVLTIKSIARRPWWGREHTRATWYEPFQDQPDIDAAVHWVLARPEVFLATVGDISLLPKVLDAVSRFSSAPDEARMREQSTRLEALPLFV